MLKKSIFNINKFLFDHNENSIFDEQYFNKLKFKYKNNDLLARSFLQYKSQIKSKKIIFLLPFICLPFIFLPFIFFILFWNKPNKNNNFMFVAVLPDKKILPSVIDENSVLFVNKFYRPNFGFQDVLFCYLIIFRFFFHPLFWLKCIYIILSYSGIVKLNSKEILVSNEYSFTSSALTKYLKLYGKTVSNCMHGEKVLCQRDCFSTYDKFYVWDLHYAEILKKMSVKSKFIVSMCEALNLDIKFDNVCRDAVFFLQGIENLNDLNNIKLRLIKISKKYDCNYFVKPHPRYNNKHISDVFSSDVIIDLPLEEVLNKCLIVASNFSTVLFQVYLYKKRTNSNFPIIFVNDLVELPSLYIMKDKADYLFSEI